VVADALSRRHTLLSSFGAQILGFDNIWKFYVFDEYFSPIYASCGLITAKYELFFIITIY